MRYLPRFPDATQHVRDRGIRLGDGGLKDLAHRGRGPRYVIVNGRALYTVADLDAWIAEQAARPVPTRSSDSGAAERAA